MDVQKQVVDRIRAAGGVLTSAQLAAIGINKYAVSQLLNAGALWRVRRGIYQLADIDDRYEQLLLACMVIPAGVICLLSALDYHGLTTSSPREIALAIPRSAWPPKLPEYPPLKLVYFSMANYLLGISVVEHNGKTFRVYDAEKSLCDAFRYRLKLGQDIALEAMREYMRRRDRNIEKVLQYAQATRVERAIRPVMEAML